MPTYVNFANYATAKAIEVHSLVFASVDSMKITDYPTLPIPSASECRCTYDSWGLIPASKPFIALPPVKDEFVDITGADGSIDATGIYGKELYGMREGSIEFYIEHYPFRNNVKISFEELKREIANFLHGKRLLVSLVSDPYVFYEGRWSIDDMHTNENWSVVTLKYMIDPKGKMTNDIDQVTHNYTLTL